MNTGFRPGTTPTSTEEGVPRWIAEGTASAAEVPARRLKFNGLVDVLASLIGV